MAVRVAPPLPDQHYLFQCLPFDATFLARLEQLASIQKEAVLI